MSRVLAVDWGERRVGLAISDPSASLARPLPTLYTRSRKETVAEIVRLIEEEEVGEVVVGLPLNMDGSKGPAAKSAEELAAHLAKRISHPVELWDERLTSVQAKRQAKELGERVGKRKGRIDARAAEILLQSYLDSRSRPGGSG